VWGQQRPQGLSLWWPIVARNKRSATLDLRQAAGQDLFRRLAATSDVLVENFRPGTLERWNVGPDELRDINPRLVITRVSGFGQDGPYAQRPAYGSVGEAMGGLRYIVGEPDRPPARLGISIGDTLAGTFAAFGTVLALLARERTGTGQVIDCAIYESVLAVMESLLPEYAIAGYTRERTGSILPHVAPSNVYPTADGGEVLIAANQDTIWPRLCAAMGRADLAGDARYATHIGRGEHQGELDELIAQWSRTVTGDELLALLDRHEVAHGRVYRAADLLDDVHVAARQAIVTLLHPVLGDFPMQNVVPRLSDTPGEIRTLGPELGEHNDEVWGGLLGLTGAEQSALRDQGVI
jgi:formyl-CoA transferase